jgi:hypothetical protein
MRFVDLVVPNVKRQHLYVLLSREKVTRLTKEFLSTFERLSERVLLSDGPEGQLKGCHLNHRTFEQPLSAIFDPHAFKSVIICKPAAAKPASVLADIHAFANLLPYVHTTKASEGLLEAHVNAIQATFGSTGTDHLKHQELSIDLLKEHAHTLFRMFDQDRSGLIDFHGNTFIILSHDRDMLSMRQQDT